MSYAVEVDNLTKYYGDRRAIDALNFHVNKGEVLGFLGPNGAGKSTTMKILTCFQPASAGTARVAGFDVFEEPLEVKRRVGYLPETPPVYRDMLVGDYLKFAAELHHVAKGKLKSSVDVALEKCGLTQVRGRMIGNLSKGYRQRVGIAQAIVHNPDVLILDEPTVGLDPKQIIEIRDLIRELSGDHTVILSTHILPEVQATCSRVLIINEGRIVANDTLDHVSARMRGGLSFVVTVRRQEGVLAMLQKIAGVAQVQAVDRALGQSTGDEALHRFMIHFQEGHDGREAAISELVKSQSGLVEARIETLSLEDVFVKLTTVDHAKMGARS